MALDPRIRSRWLAALLVAALPSVSLPGSLQSEDRSLGIERIQFNLLANSSLLSRATEANVPIPQWVTVSAATNSAPIQVTTPIPHGLATGDEVLIKDVQGNVAANGWWTVTATTETSFSLDGSAGGAEYAGGGAVFPAAGQPQPPGARDSSGNLPWTPWFSAPAVARETEFFQPTGEVYTLPETPPVNSFLSQEIDGSLFRPGQSLCLSIEARSTEAFTGDQRLKILVTAAFASVRVYGATFPAALMTPDYQRFGLCFQLDGGAIPEAGVLRVEFINEHLRGIPNATYWRRPMLNEGLAPAPWTPKVGPRTRTRAFY